MAKAKSLSGKDLMLWIGGKVVALSKSCDLQLSLSTIDSSTKDDGNWDSPSAGNMSWSVNNESVDSADSNRTNDVVFDDLFDLYVAGEPVEVTFGVATNKSDDGLPTAGWNAPTAGGYKGSALITNLSRSANKGDNASVTVSLQGVGKLEKI